MYFCFVFCHPLLNETMDLAHNPYVDWRSRGRSHLRGEECKERMFLYMVFPHVRSATAEMDIVVVVTTAHGCELRVFEHVA